MDTQWSSSALFSAQIGEPRARMLGAGTDDIGYALWSAGARAAITGSDDHHTLSYIVRGGPVYEMLGDAREKIEGWAGHFSFHPAGTRAHWIMNENTDILHIYLSKSVLAHIASDIFKCDDCEDFLLSTGFRTDPNLSGLVRYVMKMLPWKQPIETALLKSLAASFSLHSLLIFAPGILTGDAAAVPGSGNSRIDRVLAHIDANLDRHLPLERLASIAGLTSYHFSRIFRREVGQTPHQFVLNARVDRAKNLLVESELAIAQVAYACGFSSQSHLTTAFRRATDMTPARYRRRHRSKAMGLPNPAFERAVEAVQP